MDENKLMIQFLSEELGTNDPKKIQNYLKGLDESKQKALAQKYQQWKEAKKKKQATKAAHGAKLDYIKSLKHICPEGEELVYFKQGGSVKCGCVGKKLEEGAKVKKASTGAVTRFKEGKKVSNNDSTKIVNAIGTITGTKSGFDRAAKEKKEKERKPVTNVATQDKNPGSTKQPMLEALERQHHKNNYKNLQSGGAVAKFKSAKCGSKMKKK